MLSDDLTALAAISMGALASAALTFGLMAGYDEEPELRRVDVESVVVPGPVVVPQPTPAPEPRVIIDYAIIRDDGKTMMVGPERPGTGWDPESLRLRYRRSR